MDSCRSCQIQPVTWRDRLRWKFFPGDHCDLPNGAPVTHKDVLTIRTIVELSFVDRLRILCSGRLMCETKTVTENLIGASITSSVAYPLPIKPLDRK